MQGRQACICTAPTLPQSINRPSSCAPMLRHNHTSARRAASHSKRSSYRSYGASAAIGAQQRKRRDTHNTVFDPR